MNTAYDIHTTGLSESELYHKVHNYLDGIPDLKVEYLPEHTGITIRVSTEGENEAGNLEHLKSIAERLKSLAEEFIWGAGEQTLAGVTGDLLRRHQLKVSTAESCTGGLLSSYITDISGSSDYFERGFITYSNSAKMELLGVSPETLEKYGAVSEQTVTEMVAGLLSHPQTDYAIAVSGIVGPVGGTSDKPVGLVYTAVGNRGHTTVKKLTLAASRIVSKKMAATAALNLLRLRMIEDLQK